MSKINARSRVTGDGSSFVRTRVDQQSPGKQPRELPKALLDNPDFLRDVVAGALQHFLYAEMDEHIGAEPYQRAEGRSTMRNGYKPRQLRTRVGTLDLLVPQARDGSFSTELFARYQRNEKALVLALMDMYLKGVSTRKVADITEELCGTRFSASTVSRLCHNLDREIEAWKKQPLDSAGYPYVFTDATWIYSHDNAQVVRIPVLVTWGVRRADGRRQILDVRTGPTESIETFKELFASLRHRGLCGVRLVVGDDHEGIVQAAAIYFPGAGFQRCITHYQRNAAGKVPARERSEIHSDLKTVWSALNRGEAEERARIIIDKWNTQRPAVAQWIEHTIWQTLNYYAFPPSHHIRLRTNNGIERINGEIKRRTRVAQIMPNQAATLRLAASIAMDITTKWETGHVYLNMNDLTEWEHTHPQTNTHIPTEIIHTIN